MTKTLPTQILLDTSILSKIISDVLDEVGAPPARKSACLNRAAARIAGTKHNWGYLTGQEDRVTALGVREEDDQANLDDDPEIIIEEASPEEAKKALAYFETCLSAALEDQQRRSEIVEMVHEAASALVAKALPKSIQLEPWSGPLENLVHQYIIARRAFGPDETIESITEDMLKNRPHLVKIAALKYMKHAGREILNPGSYTFRPLF